MHRGSATEQWQATCERAVNQSLFSRFIPSLSLPSRMRPVNDVCDKKAPFIYPFCGAVSPLARLAIARQHRHTPPTNAWRRRRALTSESRVVSRAARDPQIRNSKGGVRGVRQAPAAEVHFLAREKARLRLFKCRRSESTGSGRIRAWMGERRAPQTRHVSKLFSWSSARTRSGRAGMDQSGGAAAAAAAACGRQALDDEGCEDKKDEEGMTPFLQAVRGGSPQALAGLI